jgi:hypothetical protein
LGRILDVAGIREGQTITNDDSIVDMRLKTLVSNEESKALGVRNAFDRQKERHKGWRPLVDAEKEIIRKRFPLSKMNVILKIHFLRLPKGQLTL